MCARWQSPLVTLINVKWLMLKEVKWWKSFTWVQPQLVFFKTKSLLRQRACSDHVFIASMLSVDSASVGPHHGIMGPPKQKNSREAQLCLAFLRSTKKIHGQNLYATAWSKFTAVFTQPMVEIMDYGPVRKSPSLHGQTSTFTPNF